MLKIGFDAKRAFLNNTGLGNYSRTVIEILSSNFPKNSYSLYTPKETKKLISSAANISVYTPGFPLFKSLWRSFGITKQLIRNPIDVYHGLSNEVPFGIEKTNVKTVVTIHDLIFLRYPQYYPFIDRTIYKWKFKHACKAADKIIAASEQTKRDIIHFFGTPNEKIEVIYTACPPIFEHLCTSEELQRIKTKWKLPDTFLLSVGTIEERKNTLILAKALRSLPENIKLVLVGKETKYTKQIKQFIQEHDLENRVFFLSDVPFSDFPAIYQQASVFVYPSVFEGFGLPILEALKSRIPVIAATGSCLEETGGTHSLYVSPYEKTEWTEAVQKILTDETLRNTMIEKGTQHALQFSEMIHAKNLMKVYEQLLSSSA